MNGDSEIRILIGADVLSSPYGGVAQVLYNLQHYLGCEGIRVDLLFLDAVPHWLRSTLPRRVTFPLLFAFRAITERKRYRVVQGQGSDGWIYGLLRSMFRKSLPPYVLMSFALENLVWRVEKEEAFLKRTKIRLQTRMIYPLTKLFPLQVAMRMADHLVISNHDVDYVKVRFSNYTVQYNGVPAHFFVTRKRDEGPPVGVMFNLTWHWRKGIYDLPEIFRRILALSDTYITVVTPEQPRSVIHMREQYPDRFNVYSGIETEVLIGLYQKHSIFVDPSVNVTPPLLVVLEAMASGMAVVTSGLPYMDSVIEHGFNGYLVTPRDVDGIIRRIGALVKDAELRKTFGRRAQDAVRRYEWERNVKTYVGVYRMLIQ